MRVLLPPSESKRPDGGNAIFSAENLLFQADLGETRKRVLDAVVAVSGDTERAQKAFKLGAKATSELQHNLRLSDAQGLAAIERYVGVLFDEIEIDELDEASRGWIADHVFIQSALFGLVSASDEIPPYRLSASSRLTDELGATLKKTWLEAFADFEWPEAFMLDLRSKDYAALAPLPDTVEWLTLDIVQRTEDGGVRALNHFNKRAKGDLVKRLARSQATITSQAEFLAWANDEGLEITETGEPHHATLVTTLGVVAAR